MIISKCLNLTLAVALLKLREKKYVQPNTFAYETGDQCPLVKDTPLEIARLVPAQTFANCFPEISN